MNSNLLVDHLVAPSLVRVDVLKFFAEDFEAHVGTRWNKNKRNNCESKEIRIEMQFKEEGIGDSQDAQAIHSETMEH